MNTVDCCPPVLDVSLSLFRLLRHPKSRFHYIHQYHKRWYSDRTDTRRYNQYQTNDHRIVCVALVYRFSIDGKWSSSDSSQCLVETYHVHIVDMEITIFGTRCKLSTIGREFTKPNFIGMIGQRLNSHTWQGLSKEQKSVSIRCIVMFRSMCGYSLDVFLLRTGMVFE